MISFTSLTIVDYAVIFVLFMSAVFSTLRGMTREFLGLLGWVVSVLVANYAKPLLENPITDLINADGLSAALAWGIPFAATVIIWFLLASILSPGLTRAGLGSLDRWLGVFFGLARGYLLVLFAFIGAVLLFPVAADPLIRRIFEKSPENIQAQQEKAYLVALGVDEEE